MRRARFTLEEQVGGLVDREDRRDHRRHSTPEEAPQRYDITRRTAPAIRATRAVEPPARHVA